MEWWQKALIGALGGLCAMMAKFLGGDINHFVVYLSGSATLLSEKAVIGYLLMTPVLMFLGAVVAGFSDQEKKLALLMISLSAPALITSWAGGSAPDAIADYKAAVPGVAPVEGNPFAYHSLNRPTHSTLAFSPFNLSLFAKAYAEGEDEATQLNPQAAPDAPAIQPSQQTDSKVGAGLQYFFNNTEAHYWLIAGSHPTLELAQQQVATINQEAQKRVAWVGKKVAPNPHYPVIIGGYLPKSDALKLQAQAIKLHSIPNDAYLSQGAN